MQLLQPKRASRRQPRVLFVGLFLAASAGASLLVWRDELRTGYRDWKQDRALKQAKQFLDQRDARNAQLALEVALAAAPGNLEAWRMAADMLEQVGAPQAMKLRRRIVTSAMDSARDHAALVLCSIKFRDFNAAKDALSAMPPAVAAQPVAMRAALTYALATDDRPVADMLFAQLRSQFPDDVELQIGHALLLLKHPREERVAAARRELERLAGDERYALPIRREFLNTAIQRRDFAEARTWAAGVTADPRSTFSDRLHLANLELLIDGRPFAELFESLAPKASRNGQDAIAFVRWLLVQNRAGEADRWVAGLAPELRGTQELAAVQAEIAVQLKAWDRLAALLEDGAWGPIGKETVRLALSARLVGEQGAAGVRRDVWGVALQSAAGQLSALRVLQRLAVDWGWDEEGESALWTITRAFPDQTWAHQSLFNLYRTRKDTAHMRDVMIALRQADSLVPRYQHDWALLSLLTDPSLAWNPAKETMQQLYQAESDNATYAAGYAFALAQAGRGDEAVTVLEKIPPAERDYAPRLPYAAYVYGVARRKPDLERVRMLALKAADFLPEEKKLFVLAEEAVHRPPEAARRPRKLDAETAAKPAPAGL